MLRVTPPLLSRFSRVLRDSSYERAPRKMSCCQRYIMIIYKALTRSLLILRMFKANVSLWYFIPNLMMHYPR